MYCGQCGKKVLENMLFCPFCGAPIVIPEQPEPKRPEPPEARPSGMPEADVRPAEPQEAEERKAAAPAAGARPMEPRQAEVQSPSAWQAAAPATDARPVEARQAEAQAPGAWQAAAPSADARPMEPRQAEAQSTGAWQTGAPAAEARPAEPRQAEAQSPGAWQAGAPTADARPMEPRQAEARAFEAQTASVRMDEPRPAGPQYEARPPRAESWEASAGRAEEETSAGPREPSRPVSLFDDLPPAGEPARAPESFVPLQFDFDAKEDSAGVEPKAAPVEIVPAEAEARGAREDAEPRPSRRPAPQEFHRPESARKRAAQTFIPVKDIDLDDMFMDGADDPDDLDEYDLDDDAPVRGRYSDAFDFEEPEHGGFLQRHIRGVVGVVLLLVLLAICAIWAFSSKGQLALARANLAWTAQPYADLGYEAYRQDSDLLAARYYEKALARDETNYEYAHSAMVAYYEAEEIESAAAMLKKCIAMNPDSAEPYQEMLILYPDPETRPWEVKELIRQGYERTGNAALNQN